MSSERKYIVYRSYRDILAGAINTGVRNSTEEWRRLVVQNAGALCPYGALIPSDCASDLEAALHFIMESQFPAVDAAAQRCIDEQASTEVHGIGLMASHPAELLLMLCFGHHLKKRTEGLQIVVACAFENDLAWSDFVTAARQSRSMRCFVDTILVTPTCDSTFLENAGALAPLRGVAVNTPKAPSRTNALPDSIVLLPGQQVEFGNIRVLLSTPTESPKPRVLGFYGGWFRDRKARDGYVETLLRFREFGFETFGYQATPAPTAHALDFAGQCYGQHLMMRAVATGTSPNWIVNVQPRSKHYEVPFDTFAHTTRVDCVLRENTTDVRRSWEFFSEIEPATPLLHLSARSQRYAIDQLRLITAAQ